MTSALLTLGTPGLTKPDLGLRYYVDAVATPSVVTAATVTEIDADYRVDGLPDPDDQIRILTHEYPPGVGGALWLSKGRKTRAPGSLVIPVREGGLALVDFDLTLYKDEALDATALTLTELGAPGDYKAAGWPDEPGTWALVWRRSGLTGRYDWTVEEPALPLLDGLLVVSDLPTTYQGNAGAVDAVFGAVEQIVMAIQSAPTDYVIPELASSLGDGVRALLKGWAEALALYRLTEGNAGIGRRIEKNAVTAEAQLNRIANGSRDLALARRTSGAGSGGSGLVVLGGETRRVGAALQKMESLL